MTMQQKIQAKKSKKGFTLVELVIVIAILAILAAIAIPVITTTINSAKISTMESDTASLNMLIKEAVNTSKASITTTTWNKKTAAEATVGDVCAENGIDDSDNYYSRKIGNATYTMVWVKVSNDDGDLRVSGEGDNEVSGDAVTDKTTIASLGTM